MRRNIIVLCSGMFVAACASPAEKCAEYGFKPGTNEYAQCQMTVDARRKSAAAAFAKASGNMGVMNQPFPQTTRTSCSGYGNKMSCTSVTN